MKKLTLVLLLVSSLVFGNRIKNDSIRPKLEKIKVIYGQPPAIQFSVNPLTINENLPEKPFAGEVFPGAVGYGAYWTFPTDYQVRKVTTLADGTGTGTFRWATSQPNTIVVFEVAGYIDVNKDAYGYLSIASNVYVAGQTAFRYGGQGITIRRSHAWSGPNLLTASNTIHRFYRVRTGSWNDPDCCGDAFTAAYGTNIIFDHMEMSYTSDETVDFTDSNNVTVQWSILNEPLSNQPGSGGKTMQGNGRDQSYAYNIFANSVQRNPALSPFRFANRSGLHNYEYVNNHGFNLNSWGLIFNDNEDGAYIHANIIGNTWQRPSNVPSPRRWIVMDDNPSTNRYYVSEDNYDSAYRPIGTTGGDVWNEITSRNDDYANGMSTPLSKSYQVLTPYSMPMIANGSAIYDGDTLEENVFPFVGTYQHRDASTTRLFNQLASNTGHTGLTSGNITSVSYFGTGYSNLNGMSGVEADSDGDGIPNSLEATWGDDTFGYVNSLVDGSVPPPTPTCSDGIQNGDETGIDCGGSCAPCSAPATGNQTNKGKKNNTIIWW
ncbi:hypothetical protein [Maribacter sp. 4U21]|uniref:hypothetical protein n=1 Tax=Maribacter sp. 4U21 TaxID=1889779 RepID=UPI000C14AF1B|nr:hypothetical protein [Maribacter sp. 4U21]